MRFNIDQSNCSKVYEAFNAIPSLIVIVKNGKIHFANQAAIDLKNNMEGELLDSLLGSSSEYAVKRIQKILYEGEKTIPTHYTFKSHTGEDIFVEATAHPIIFYEEPAVMVFAEDITKRINDIYSTSIEQQKQFHVGPMDANDLLITSSYKAANFIGGDFFFFHALSETETIGVIGDVTGEGTLAAMAISSFEVIFHEAIEHIGDFEAVVYKINEKISKYYHDRYVAALLFHVSKDTVTICNCGINQFLTVSKKLQLADHTAKGPFLGMLSGESKDLFDFITFDRSDYKRLIFYTDGYSMVKSSNQITEEDYRLMSSTEINSKVLNELKHFTQLNGKLADDVAFMCIDLDFEGEITQEVIYGIQDMKRLIHRFVQDIENDTHIFRIKLILSELITNAFKYGNSSNTILPIGVKKIKSSQKIIIKVTDMAIIQKTITIPETTTDEDLLKDHGRGLFILSQICDKIYYDCNNIIAEYIVN